MTGALDPAGLNACGCCEPCVDEPAHLNPPGREALAYRAGTHPLFFERMLARIHRWQVPDGDDTGQRPFAALTTRATDDPSIALMDAGSTLLDVLTFYQERIANEGFLRTATERRSVLELARAIGYELRPGVAAETFVAFTVEQGEGAPAVADIPAGTQIQSVPGAQGELPQTFETAAGLMARAGWNALRPRLGHPQILTPDVTHVYLAGTATGVARGDVVLLMVDGQPYPKEVLGVELDTAARRTRVAFASSLVEPVLETPGYADGVLDPNRGPLALTRDSVRTEIFQKTWREGSLQSFLTRNSWDANEVLAFVDDLRAETFAAPGSAVLALRERLGFFGHNAPRQELLARADVTRGGASETATDPFPTSWDATNACSIWENSQGTEHSAAETYADAYLERSVAGLVEGSWVAFSAQYKGEMRHAAYIVKQAFEASLADYAISGKATGLNLATAAIPSAPRLTSVDKPPYFLTRTTTARVRSELILLAPLPNTSDLLAGQGELWLDGMAVGLTPGQSVVLSGEVPGAEDCVRTELLTLAEVVHSGGYTKLVFENGLAHTYRRGSVTLNANVARVSHGETVAGEVLGSGDGSVPHQAFTLKKPPLTYRSAANPRGTESTLVVRVDRVAWKEVASLYGCGPTERVYTVRHDDRANATVIFGDSRSGARPTSGRENVTATYRSSIGSSGNVGSSRLMLLKTRPFGIRAVTNPLPASGAEDPETLAGARMNAPLTTLTLDRIVSLQDYEDFARSYAGIGKAGAAIFWNGGAEVVHLTVTDAAGAGVVDPLDKNLLGAIESVRDPFHNVVLASHQSLLFFVKAALLIDAAYVWEDVKRGAETALKQAFSFEQRAFAQPVTAAEIVRVMHGVLGVVAVDLDELYSTTPGSKGIPGGSLFNAVLDARPARYDEAQHSILPAELLLIHDFGITLTRMSR